MASPFGRPGAQSEWYICTLRSILCSHTYTTRQAPNATLCMTDSTTPTSCTRPLLRTWHTVSPTRALSRFVCVCVCARARACVLHMYAALQHRRLARGLSVYMYVYIYCIHMPHYNTGALHKASVAHVAHRMAKSRDFKVCAHAASLATNA